MRKKIAFIGVGNMASAIINGMASAGFDMSDVILFDRHIEKMQPFADKGAIIVSSVEAAVKMSDCVMICVKPQGFSDILPLIAGVDGAADRRYITIAAGITMESISDSLGGVSVVRALPNTPIMIGKGVSAICRNEGVSDADFDFVCSLFSPSSKVLKINEDQMNRIICVTSSSPAYIFLLIEAMLDGAISQGLVKNELCPEGLDENEIVEAICDTIIGSAELMKSGTKTPDEQIKTVASKGGTTERALAELREYRFSEAVVSAMKKCTERADELGRK